MVPLDEGTGTSRGSARGTVTTPRTGAGAALTLATQQQGKTQGLIQHPRKRVRRIDGDGSQQRIDFALVEIRGMLELFPGHVLVIQHADARRVQSGSQRLVPAAILTLHKVAQLGRVAVEGLFRRQAVRSHLVVAIFNSLHDAGDANLDKFVEIGGGDGQEFHALQQRIREVLSFLQNAAVEAQP